MGKMSELYISLQQEQALDYVNGLREENEEVSLKNDETQVKIEHLISMVNKRWGTIKREDILEILKSMRNK